MAGASGLHWVDSGAVDEGEISDSMWGDYPMPDGPEEDQARLDFSDRLVAAGGDALLTNGHLHWSSTDRPEYGYCAAWGLSLSSGSKDFDQQAIERSVRAVARF